MDYQKLVEAFSDLALYELDASGRVRGWGEAAVRLFGYTAGDIAGRPATELYGMTESLSACHELETAVRDGKAERSDWAIRKDGSRFWARQMTIPIRDEDQRVTGFARVVRDASHLRAAADERDRIFELSVDLICIADFNGFFTRISPSFTRVLGHAPAELLGTPFIQFVHPDDVAMTREESAAIASGRNEPTRRFQNRYRCADGSYRWLEWRSQAATEERLIYAMARDVTEQKGVERRLDEYARELERSNGELQQFAYVASHDLQEPLRAVSGCVQMLGERNVGKLDERSVELMGYAVDGAKRMAILINDLLAFSRVGSKGINKAWINPRQAIDKALQQLQVAVAESGVSVTIGDLPQAWADPVQLAQLFQNLLGNAFKFRSERRPEVRVEAEQGTSEVIFSVRDNGIGIEPEYHGKIFGVFQRLHGRGAYAGTGIGLAICKKIVERHGGRIWIESRAGEGSNFRFSIPDGSTS